MSAREPWKVTLPMGRPQSFAREADAVAYAAQHGGTVTDTRKRRAEASAALSEVTSRDDIPADVRAAVRSRSRGRCEIRLPGCSGGAASMHHRLKRRAGVHTLENILHTCANCHTASPAALHRNVAWARRVGLIIDSWDGPQATEWVRPPAPWSTEYLSELPAG